MRDKTYSKQQMSFIMLLRTGSCLFTKEGDKCISCAADKTTGLMLEFKQTARNKFKEIVSDEK